MEILIPLSCWQILPQQQKGLRQWKWCLLHQTQKVSHIHNYFCLGSPISLCIYYVFKGYLFKIHIWSIFTLLSCNHRTSVPFTIYQVLNWSLWLLAAPKVSYVDHYKQWYMLVSAGASMTRAVSPTCRQVSGTGTARLAVWVPTG